MLGSPRTAPVAVACLALALFVSASTALAAGPASAVVRVEGLTETKLLPTQVTTTSAPVVKDGNPAHACPGTNAAGALELATGGNWSGKWSGGGLNKEGKFEGLGYSVDTVLGESHPFFSGAFWDMWFNNSEAQRGVCEQELQAGDQILLFPCSEAAKECPAPLGIEVRSSASAGEPVLLTVKKYNPKGEASPAAGASVTGGAAPASTDAGGHATVTFASAGQVTVRASAPEAVRAETTVCVHAGNDGTCGTTVLSVTRTSAPPSGSPPPASYTGPFALVAKITGLAEHHVYSRRHAPRVLAGTVIAHTAVTSVSIALRRRYRNRCSAYSGPRALFVHAPCGTASFFQVARSASFSYLLPAALAPGRYVLDVEATDAAGNRTALARGTSRIVFYVR